MKVDHNLKVARKGVLGLEMVPAGVPKQISGALQGSQREDGYGGAVAVLVATEEPWEQRLLPQA